MPKSQCHTCFNAYNWRWEEAFDKFGFNDGDGQVETELVVDVLQATGYQVNAERWGLHNIVIVSIRKDDQELIPDTATVGYDNPHDYLPPKIIQLLTEKLPEDGEVQA